MSRDFTRKDYRDYHRDGERGREWRERNEYRYEKDRSLARKRSRSPPPRDLEKRRVSRSPRKGEKDVLDDNILSEISKLPEPSELWDNQNQNTMQDSGFPPPPPLGSFPAERPYAGNYQPSYSGIYDEFPSLGSVQAPPAPDMSTWNQMSLPPPPTPPVYNVEDQIKKEAAIETEMRHQKAALSKQREDYIKKTAILKKELDTLKDQRNELRGDAKRSPSPDTKRFLKENTKLQLEIQNKLKTINNVVDMLNGIIGEQAPEIVETDETTERSSKRKSRSPSAGKKFNYVYYDPEMHWCRVCNEFPPTAKDYLNHLHSPAHHKMAAQHMEAPWHSVTGVNEGFPSFPSAPTKRTPIRGLQFFVPSTAWYCKLCDQFIGDLHCASAHLKSLTHSKNYTNFVEQNPHWETDWMSDRQKAFEKARAGGKAKPAEEKPQPYTATTITFNKDGFHTKRKADSPPPAAEVKKKKEKRKKSKRKRSSSSSSSSSSSGSDSEPKKKKKKDKKNKSAEKLTEWVSSLSSLQMNRLNDSDRKLLDNIKNRIQQDKEGNKRRTETPVIDLCDTTRERESRARDERDRERSSRARSRARDERDSRARESRARDDRDKREESRRRDDRRDDRRDERRSEARDRRSPARGETKAQDKRKMPFIGKMPVFKSLSKNKTEEKKEEEKKKEDDDSKKRQEIDAEIQKKVAEFKEKIAKAQLERQQAELPPPQLVFPMPFLPPAPAPAPAPAPPAHAPPPPASTPQPAAPALPKDFQDALDIIFPSAEQHAEMAQQNMFSGIPGLDPNYPGIPGLMNPFPQLSLLGQPPPHMMMGFDMNPQLFGPRPQLYDTHVPLVPNNRQNKNKQAQDKRNNQNNRNNQIKNYNSLRNTNKNNNQNKNKNKNATQNINPTKQNTPATNATSNTQQMATTTVNTNNATNTADATATAVAAAAVKKKEEMDDLAMLGIDASDVGAGI